jgi:hypothetical protein
MLNTQIAATEPAYHAVSVWRHFCTARFEMCVARMPISAVLALIVLITRLYFVRRTAFDTTASGVYFTCGALYGSGHNVSLDALASP